MAIITNAGFRKYADRVGSQFKILDKVITDVDLGTHHVDNVISDAKTLDDTTTKSGYDVIVDLATPFKTADDDFVDEAKVEKTLLQNLISAMESHATRLGAASLDDFLTTSGIQIGENYAEAYRVVKGIKLSAKNTYSEREIELGDLRITSSGVGTFTSRLSMGSGSGKYVLSPDSSLNVSSTFLAARVASGIGSNPVLLQLNMKDEFDNNLNMNWTIPGGSAVNTVVMATTSSRRFYKINSLYFAGGNTGDGLTFLGQILRPIGL